MSRLGRRVFLTGAAATCIGCAGTGSEVTSDDPASDPPGADSPTTTQAPSATGESPIQVTPSPDRTYDLGTVDEVQQAIDDADGFLYVPEARAWVVRYPAEALADAADHYDDATLAGLDAGFLALHQKCTHLGCRVPECTSSGRFECPCHGQVFNRVGEHVTGPAPRGMDRFTVRIEDGRFMVDAHSVLRGLPAGASTVVDDPAGPSCIGLDTTS